MKTRKLLGLAWRLGVCAAVLVAIAAYFARDLAPSVPLAAALTCVMAALAIIGAALFATIYVEGSFNRWSFRKGGTDTQWLWFREDPPGTARLRELRRDDPQ